MKSKLAMGLVLASILILSVGLMGCVGDMIGTGGGFLEECEGKVSFGFNFHATGSSSDYDVKGEFQLVDHGEKPPLRIHGTFEEVDSLYIPLVGFQYVAKGLCTIKHPGGVYGPTSFCLYAYDAGEPGIDDDFVWIKLSIPGPDIVYSGKLDGGNIQIHEKK